MRVEQISTRWYFIVGDKPSHNRRFFVQFVNGCKGVTLFEIFFDSTPDKLVYVADDATGCSEITAARLVTLFINGLL